MESVLPEPLIPPEQDLDYIGPPLHQVVTVRVSVPMYASAYTQSLIEGCTVSKIFRRWARAGARAEGHTHA